MPDAFASLLDVHAPAFGAPATEVAAPIARAAVISLSQAAPGHRGVVVQVGSADDDLDHGVTRSELERRLLEIGFVEGARITVLHEGLIGHDPIALQLDDMRVALRRREAQQIMVRLDPDAPPPPRRRLFRPRGRGSKPAA